MALADSGRAIGAVTRLLQDHLLRRGFEVSVGRPEQAATSNTNAKLNLFLYETGFDGHLRNHSLRDGEPAPLWMVLKYLLTAFDAAENSDSADAHELLGRGLSALNDLNFLALDALVAPAVRLALENNPEPLKVTFDETTADLLSKIMQGTDERYRLSVAFQMRPVMIVPGVEPHASLLVGVDYTSAPATMIGEKGIQIDVLPSLGASLDRVEPAAFEAGERIEIHGDDLNGADLEVVLGDVVLTITARRPDLLVVTAEGDPGGNPQGPIAAGTAISAGEHPLTVRRRLSATRTRSSNLLAARLRPTVTSAAIVGSNLVITGLLLGTDADDVVIAFYQDGRTVRQFDTVTTTANQQTLTVATVATAVPAGSYRAILRVNNQQAKASPTVTVP
jgi:Pvc16 N-terminal domain